MTVRRLRDEYTLISLSKQLTGTIVGVCLSVLVHLHYCGENCLCAEERGERGLDGRPRQ